METLIEIKNITKTFENKKVLNDISFSINKGEIFGIIGQSGAGKTVFLKALIGFYKPDSGDILFEGKSVFKNQKEILKTIGFASQRHSIYPDLSLKENLKYFGRLYGMKSSDIKENTKKVLELVELTDYAHKLAGKLSGGMQRRLDIACALVHSPKILILDEPEAGLDPVLRKHIAELIQKIRNEGTTIILSSHFMNEIEPLCDRVAMLKQGTLAAYGSPMELLTKYADNYEIVIRSYPGNYNNILAWLKKSGLTIITSKIEGNRLLIYVPQKSAPDAYVEFIVQSLKPIKETLMGIQLNQLSLDILFERIAVK